MSSYRRAGRVVALAACVAGLGSALAPVPGRSQTPDRAPGAPPADVRAAPFAARGDVGEGLTVEATFDVRPAEAFRLWTDPERLRSVLGLEARIDLAVGGRYELLFGHGVAPEGQQGSEGCQVLSYVPGELLTFSWNAPPQFTAERPRHTWVAITFSPLGDGARTAVRLRHVGFGEGGRWREVEAYFRAVWPGLLGAMAEGLRPR